MVFGKVEENVFARMINDALEESPESLILFKVHPDNLHNGFIPKEAEGNPRVRLLTEPINPIDLLENVQKVYVATSQMGLEAMICNGPVKAYGGGISQNVRKTTRRKRILAVEELFYITYCVYSHYVDPVSEKEVQLGNIIQRIVEQRKNFIN